MTKRTITAPGVEIFEHDRSDYTSNVQQTSVLVTGFAPQGEENTTFRITSKTGLINQFGRPTNEAERYFYTACSEVLNQGGILYAARLPYENASTGYYNAVTYTVAAAAASESGGDGQRDIDANIALAVNEIESRAGSDTSIDSILVANDTSITGNITNIKYTALQTVPRGTVDAYNIGEQNVAANTIVIVDKLRSTYAKSNDGKECVGIIPVITTATNALYAQDLLTGTAGTDAYKLFSPVSGTVNYTGAFGSSGTITPAALAVTEFAIPANDANIYTNTIARTVSKQFPAIGYADSGKFDREHFKKIGVVVLKAFVDNGANNLINFEVVESFVGTLGVNDIDQVTKKSTYIGDIVNAGSNYINVFSNVEQALIDTTTIFSVSQQEAASLGFRSDSVNKTISRESIFTNLDIIFERNSDIHEKSIDIVVDAGVTNIAAYCSTATEYNPATTNTAITTLAPNWLAAVKKFDTFCKNIRKDCIFVCDGIRKFCLEGSKKIVRESKPGNTIDGAIIPNTKYMCGLNSNYTAGYCNWFQVADDSSGKLFWCPPSIIAAGCYIYTDINYNVWDAPAGQRRGIANAIDCAFNPSIRQAGALYDKAWNYAINYADIGLIVEGQKTMAQKTSAFDRVNVRRLFLRLERTIYNIARSFVYEPNNSFTRQRLHDLVDAELAIVKASGGCYDYKVVCDETINTPSVIDNNELRIKVGVQPVKTAEFVIIEFSAVNVGGGWTEI